MRIARFIHGNDHPQYAFVQQDTEDGKDYLVVLSGYPFAGQQVVPTGERYPLDSDGIRLLAPLLPSKIYGIENNWSSQHKGPLEPLTSSGMNIYMKPSSSISGPDDPIVFPDWSQDITYGPTLAVVIGRLTRNISERDALNHVLGYMCANDLCARDNEKHDHSGVRAHGFDTSTPVGPWIQTHLDPENTNISLSINGETIASACGTTADLLYSAAQQISYISSFATLLPGDIILTGTPAETNALRVGDETIVHIDGLGSLRNIVVSQ